jgi:hypothetical protein
MAHREDEDLVPTKQPPADEAPGSVLVTPDRVTKMDRRRHGEVGETVASALLCEAVENNVSRVTGGAYDVDGDWPASVRCRRPARWDVQTPEGRDGWVPDEEVQVDGGEHTVVLEVKSGGAYPQDNQKAVMRAFAEPDCDVTVMFARVRFTAEGFDVSFSRLTPDGGRNGSTRWERVFVADLADP